MSAHAARPGGSIQWLPCGKGVECGTLAVPVDRTRPQGSRIVLTLARHEAEDPAGRRGVLLINPGGPGDSGTAWITNPAVLQSFPPALRQHFDIIGFDPRGVPGSAALRCPPRAGSGLRPRDRQEFARLVAEQQQWFASCTELTGELANHLDSRSVAGDIEAIRIALDEDRINWLGYSYGTMFGLTYAEMFPKRVRAMVLDGVVDHSTGLEDLVVGEALAAEAVFRDFAKWCADTPACVLHGRDVGGLWDALAARAARAPVPVGGQQVDDAWLQYRLLKLLSPPRRWTQAAALIANASGLGVPLPVDDEPGRSAIDPGFDMGAVIAVGDCSDYPLRSHDYDAISAVAAGVASRAPRFGVFITWRDVGMCAGWSGPPSDPIHPLRATGLAPVVLINATGDFATPLTDARTVADQLPARSFVTVDADRHGLYGYGVACIDSPVNRYLVDLMLPPPELRCGF